jgi:hypothetical protein
VIEVGDRPWFSRGLLLIGECGERQFVSASYRRRAEARPGWHPRRPANRRIESSPLGDALQALRKRFSFDVIPFSSWIRH